MQKKNSYEDLRYTGAVNVIGADVFPRSFPLHWHNHVEIAVWLEEEGAGTGGTDGAGEAADTDTGRTDTGADDAGEGSRSVLHVNQTVYRMNPGDILFIWPGEMHEIAENVEGRLTGLQFSAALFNDLPDFTPFFHLFRTFHRITASKEPELARKFMTHIRRIVSVQGKRDTFSGVEAVICLYEMFMDFGNYVKNTVLEEATPCSAGAGRTFEKVSAVCGYIIDNCERELTLESAAALAGFSACYFSRIFKQFTNYNFVEYLTMQRIKRAQLLLADSDKAVTEISYQAGFKSISTFNRVFRQYRGCSPSEYRKYYLK